MVLGESNTVLAIAKEHTVLKFKGYWVPVKGISTVFQSCVK